MSETTRDQFIEVALKLFAEKGFDGVSIAQIARELDLTKQALLHHFSSKEKLYGEVLARISDQFARRLEPIYSTYPEPIERYKALMAAMIPGSDTDRLHSRLLMRELLDNQHRAITAERWYMKPFLASLEEALRTVPGWETVPQPQLRAHLYQMLGAINYYAISPPTLEKIYGTKDLQAMDDGFEENLRTMVDVLLRSLPARL